MGRSTPIYPTITPTVLRAAPSGTAFGGSPKPKTNCGELEVEERLLYVCCVRAMECGIQSSAVKDLKKRQYRMPCGVASPISLQIGLPKTEYGYY
jgi:hypothetical protein